MFLAYLLYRTAQLWPEHPAVVCGDRSFTWRQTLDRVLRLARVVSEAAGGPQGRVAVLALNGIEYYEVTMAAPVAAVPMVPINTRLAEPELVHLLGEAAPRAVFFDAAHRSMVETLRDRLPSVERWIQWGGEPAEFAEAYEPLLEAATPLEPVEVDAEHPWAVIYTGGTTGMPKGVVLSRRAFTFNLNHILRDLSWGQQPRFLQVTPLFHLAALGPSYAVSAWGGTQVFLPAFSMDSLLEQLSAHRCTATALVPTMIGWLVNRPDLDRFDLSELRYMGYGASAIPEPVIRRALELFPQLTFNQFYGQTEAGGGAVTLRAHQHSLDPDKSHRLRSAGQPINGARVVVQDGNGAEVPRGTWGEICIRSDGLFSGYLEHPEQTAEAMRGGWLHTGDVGFMDEDGFVYVTDRLKDMIVTGGENVSSSEVENVILQHPGVAAVAVIACPDSDWGERVHAVVVAREGAELTGREVIDFCRERIANYKRPKSVTVQREPLPLSAVGKVRKDLLRALYRNIQQEGQAA